MQKSNAFPNAAAILAALILSFTLSLSGCLSFFQQSPRYVNGTRLEIQTDSRGEEYYIAVIGKSKTTTIEAALSSSGEYSIVYTFIDTQWILAESLAVDSDCCFKHLESPNPVRVENGQGDIIETDRIEVRRNLLEQILDSDNPTISVLGKQGTVIIEIGSESRKHLKELLNYGKERFPES
ncbi:MAG: hypothetical protein KAH21_11240 [Spirochaetaceae bacterium]|nr:hypothetical protein [Spirochaetaceae bacterium]